MHIMLKSAAEQAEAARQRPQAGDEAKAGKLARARKALAEALKKLAKARQGKRRPLGGDRKSERN